MPTQKISLLVAFALALSANLLPQPRDDAKKEFLQQQVAELKRSIAANRASLQKYQWTETTEVDVKGDTKKTEQKLCQYGPDGKVQKTPLGPPPEPPKARRGVRGRIIAKKADEMKDYMERLKSLIGHYVPPNHEKLQEVFQTGKANLNASSGGVASLVFTDYYKPGDKVTFAFDTAAKKIQSFTVHTYLDDPKTDIVSLSANWGSLADGTNYVSQADLVSESKHIEIKTANSKYQKIQSLEPEQR